MSIYAQITTRCNMSCAHCCFNCTDIGEDMEIKTFDELLKQTHKTDITIGGGEPTIHPQFWDFIALGLEKGFELGIITNGSMTETTLKLAHMASLGKLAVILSLYDFHDTTDPLVLEAFDDVTKHLMVPYPGKIGDYRAFRDVSGRLANGGMCDFGGDKCICNSHVIKPSGKVKQCGCDEAPIVGSIGRGFHYFDEFCYRVWGPNGYNQRKI